MCSYKFFENQPKRQCLDIIYIETTFDITRDTESKMKGNKIKLYVQYKIEMSSPE